MRRIAASAAITLATALACAACWPGAGQALAATPSRAVRSAPRSVAACYAFAVSALLRHVIVRRTPPACAGLGAAQLNQVIGRAIRTVAGPLHKAAARRQDQAESRYLASLVRQGRPPLPESLAAGPGPASGTQGARLAALAAWLAAALAGGYLLAGRRPPSRRWTRGLGLAGGHAGLAVAGLCLWIAFLVTAEPVLGWTDVALSWLIVGLGMATLLGGIPGTATAALPEPAAAPAGKAALAAPARARAPVLVIALHGTLATVTIVLVLLAVVSTG